MLKARLQRGDYIKSWERKLAAAIAAEFPEWAGLQKIPADAGAWNWKRAGEFHSLARAKER